MSLGFTFYGVGGLEIVGSLWKTKCPLFGHKFPPFFCRNKNFSFFSIFWLYPNHVGLLLEYYWCSLAANIFVPGCSGYFFATFSAANNRWAIVSAFYRPWLFLMGFYDCRPVRMALPMAIFPNRSNRKTWILSPPPPPPLSIPYRVSADFSIIGPNGSLHRHILANYQRDFEDTFARRKRTTNYERR